MDISGFIRYNDRMPDTAGKFAAHFLKAVGRPFREGVALKEFSQFRVGGCADYFFEAESDEEVFRCIRFCCASGLPFYVLGGGTNILFADDGFRGLVLRIRTSGIKRAGPQAVEIAAGETVAALTAYCLENELGGLEYLAGIPGTIGGAVCGNAGAFGRSIGETLKSAVILSPGAGLRIVGQEYFAFEYRWSRLKATREILLSTVLSVRHQARAEIEAAVKENIKLREKKHPPCGTWCAGSYFKNPLDRDGCRIAAAKLLDQVGAKGMRKGGAGVFSGHANFIINEGNASAEDIRNLAAELKRKVKAEFGIELQEEVIFLPAIPSSG